MSIPSTLEFAIVEVIVNNDISTSPEDIPLHLHFLIERMKKIKQQIEKIEYIQQKWYWLLGESFEAEDKAKMYQSLIDDGCFNQEEIEYYKKVQIFYEENQLVFIAAMVENDLQMVKERDILKLLKRDLPNEYMNMCFDTTHVRYTKESDSEFRYFCLNFIYSD